MGTIKKQSLKFLKKAASKEIQNTTKNRCLFLCYQPKLPKSLKNEIKSL
ncbi:cyclic lactone autoinducer peptide [Thomasclavelia sp.]